MFEKVDTLPGDERRPTVDDWNRKLRLHQRCPDVRRHFVRAFHGVGVKARIFRRQLAEESLQVPNDVRIGIFLNHQGSRSVLHKDR